MNWRLLSAAALIVAGAILALASLGVLEFGSNGGPPADVQQAAPPGQDTLQDSSPSPEPTAAAGPTTASTSAIARLSVPRIGIDAPVAVMGVTADGIMQDPPGPTVVAWYDFSARPGAVGNVVMSGHVDYANYGPAVFYRLRDLRAGDEIRVTLADGSVFSYHVQSVTTYDADTAPVSEIVGRTPNESITLITCNGTFDRTSRQYDQRLIVRGARLAGGG